MTVGEQELLKQFFEHMKKEVDKNGFKGDMSTWHPNAYELISETAYHLAKLNKAMLEVERGDIQSARKEVDEFSADVANIMAKCSQMLGTITINDDSNTQS